MPDLISIAGMSYGLGGLLFTQVKLLLNWRYLVYIAGGCLFKSIGVDIHLKA